MTNLLTNGDFETDWGEEGSHAARVFMLSGTEIREVGNIFTPPGWETWFYHSPGVYDQPEVTDTVGISDPNRTLAGERAMRLFTFNRRHDGGFLQQVPVDPGTRLLLTARAHAWSNHDIEGYEHYNNARCSVGVGCEGQYILDGDAPALNGDPLSDAIGNFTFYVGIDPTGGLDPYAPSVVWGQGAHIYNTYALVPPVEVVAEAAVVTVFLRSVTKWAFKNNDAYWDNIRLVVRRGLPRVQYARTYVLLPPNADAAWATAAVTATWDRNRFTVGGSADDAGIGSLDSRRVIAVNPAEWDGDVPLGEWYELHYPGVEYVPIEAEDPATLLGQLGAL